MGGLARPPMSEPPTAPAVAAQQGGPVGHYLSNYQSSGQGSVGPPPMALVEQKLNSVASDLRDVAKVLVMSKPALMPVLQKMIQAGAMLMQEINSEKQQGQQQQSSGPPEAPGGDDSQAAGSPTMDQ